MLSDAGIVLFFYVCVCLLFFGKIEHLRNTMYRAKSCTSSNRARRRLHSRVHAEASRHASIFTTRAQSGEEEESPPPPQANETP